MTLIYKFLVNFIFDTYFYVIVFDYPEGVKADVRLCIRKSISQTHLIQIFVI